MKKILYLLFAVFFLCRASAQDKITGKVVSAGDHLPLPGATIRLKHSKEATISGPGGMFSIRAATQRDTLVIKYIGFRIAELPISAGSNNLLVTLFPQEGALQEVVVSTGYQSLPKERATGSFVQLDADALNRRVSSDILSRLEDQAPGLTFNRGVGGTMGANRSQLGISIRGQSTISAKVDPLIVVDNFPYQGDLASINPNDVESVTLLKDAAAASIWGAQSGNGVIVITTKRGKLNQKERLSFNSNVTTGEKPDLFYQSRMSPADYIDIEKNLFAQGFYRSLETNVNKYPLTPVVKLLIAARDGHMSAGEADQQIEALKKQDVRSDLSRYFYRSSLAQQYALSLSGGRENSAHRYSAGFDRSLASLKGNSQNRFTASLDQSWFFLNRKGEFRAGLNYAGSRNTLNDAATISFPGYTSLYPYARLADDAGNALPIDKLNTALTSQAAAQGLLDWTYRPLDELNYSDNHTSSDDYRLNASLSYRILPELKAEVLWQYGSTRTENRQLQDTTTWYTRDQINRLTQVNGASLTRPVPVGGILDLTNGRTKRNYGRAQLNYALTTGNHELSALAGFEGRDVRTVSSRIRRYGYDAAHGSFVAVDYLGAYRSYVNPSSTSNKIFYNDASSDLSDRFLSWYANASYTYSRRYTVSGSARLDQSNIFGVNTNQKGVPLWSAGLAWNIHNEAFYQAHWLSYLKLRATYGLNGNVDNSMSAYVTASYNAGTSSLTLLPFATVSNPPNPDLRWEKVKTANLGLDFRTAGEVLSGSLDVYSKKGTDLIGDLPWAPSTGISSFKGNYAATKGSGADLLLNSRNLKGKLGWNTAFILSYVHEKVTDYAVKQSARNYMILGYAYQGKPLYSIFSFPYAGLDPQTGDPVGYLNGQESKDYSTIISSTDPSALIYNGPARPTVSGSLRNAFSYKGFTLSAGIGYRLGYYFRRSSVTYYDLLRGQGGHGDYQYRWREPGDEQKTIVPSMPASGNTNRDFLYSNSPVLVEKGDHIRLQDLQASWSLPSASVKKMGLSSMQVYAYANNLGIIWKATKTGLDPDYLTLRQPVTIAAGIRAEF